MTARELIKKLEELPDSMKDMDVVYPHHLNPELFAAKVNPIRIITLHTVETSLKRYERVCLQR